MSALRACVLGIPAAESPYVTLQLAVAALKIIRLLAITLLIAFFVLKFTQVSIKPMVVPSKRKMQKWCFVTPALPLSCDMPESQSPGPCLTVFCVRTQSDSWFLHNSSIYILNIVFGACCLIATLVSMLVLGFRFNCVKMSGKRWCADVRHAVPAICATLLEFTQNFDAGLCDTRFRGSANRKPWGCQPIATCRSRRRAFFAVLTYSQLVVQVCTVVLRQHLSESWPCLRQLRQAQLFGSGTVLFAPRAG